MDSSHLCLSYLPSQSSRKLPQGTDFGRSRSCDNLCAIYLHSSDPQSRGSFCLYFLICLHLISHFVQKSSGRKFQALIQSSENLFAWKEKHHPPKMCQARTLPGARQAWVRGPPQPSLGCAGVTIHAPSFNSLQKAFHAKTLDWI